MHLTIKAKLLIVLTCLSAALLAMAAAAWISLSLNNASFRSVHDDRVAPLRQLKILSDMYAVNIVDTVHKVRNRQWDWEAGLRSVEVANREITRQWLNYLQSGLTTEEQGLATEAQDLMAAADRSVHRLEGLLAAHDRPGLDAYVVDELYPSIDPLTQKVAQLVDLQLRVASADFDSAQRVFAASWWILAALTLFSLVAVALGAWVTVRGVSQPLSAMTAAMTRLARRDMTVTIPGTGQSDEIGAMAQAVEVFREATLRSDLYEAELADQRRWLQELLDNLPVGVTVCDEDERVVFRNREMNRLHPHPEPESLIGRKAEDLFRSIARESPPTAGAAIDPDAYASGLVERYRSAREGRFETQFPSGVIAGVRFRWIDGRRLILVQTDISALRAAEDTARRFERLLSDAISELPVSFCLLANDGALDLYNAQFLREFGLSPDQVRPGMTLPEFLGVCLQAGTIAAVDEKARHDFLGRDRAQTDVERPAGIFRIQRSAMATGEHVRVALDITDLRQKEAEIRRLGESALAQRTAILHEVLNAVPQAIGVLDSAHRLIFANATLARAVAASEGAGSLDGLPLPRLLKAVGIEPDVAAPLFTIHAQEREIEVNSADSRPLRLRTTPVATGEQLVMVSDLTAQRQQEAERLEQQQRLLQGEKSQALVTLAGSIAHDFNNLLAVIAGFSRLASESVQQLAQNGGDGRLAEIASSLDKVVASADRGKNIVTSLNVLIKERPTPTARIDLRETVRSSEQLLRVLIPASVQLDLELSDQPCRILASPTPIEQIVTNLAVNAVHALEGRAGRVTISVDRVEIDGGRADGLQVTGAAEKRLGNHVDLGPGGEVSIFVGVLRPGGYVRLRVTDDGCGMSEAIARKILTPFFTTQEAGKGTGLGLVSVLEIVDAHRGGVHIVTREGSGTSFSVLFPESAAAAGDLPEEPSASAPIDAPVPIRPADELRMNTRILVVDDEELLVELAARALERCGYEVEGFIDPAAALHRVQSDPDGIDLVVTDQTMPTITGVELVERMLQIRGDLPVVICTGVSAAMENKTGLSPRIRSIVQKPYLPSDLAAAVRQALADP